MAVSSMKSPIRLTETALDDLVNLEPLAPLHQRHQLRQRLKTGTRC